MNPSDEAPYPDDHAGLRVQAVPGGSQCLFETVDRRGQALAHVVLETPELDGLVQLLAELRAIIGESVPKALDPEARLVVLVDPVWNAKLLSGPDTPDGVVLALRHPGLGWLGFLLPLHETAALGSALVQLAPRMPTPT